MWGTRLMLATAVGLSLGCAAELPPLLCDTGNQATVSPRLTLERHRSSRLPWDDSIYRLRFQEPFVDNTTGVSVRVRTGDLRGEAQMYADG